MKLSVKTHIFRICFVCTDPNDYEYLATLRLMLNLQEMHKETMQMFSRGLPLWQRMLVPTLASRAALKMSGGVGLTEALSANMRIVEGTFG